MGSSVDARGESKINQSCPLSLTVIAHVHVHTTTSAIIPISISNYPYQEHIMKAAKGREEGARSAHVLN